MARTLLRTLLVTALTLSAPAAVAATDCSLKQIASIPAVLTPHNELVMDATINDQPARIQVDTGASISTLSKKFAERLGMPIEDMGAYVYGLSGEALNEKTRISTMRLGNLRSSNEGFVLAPGGGDGTDGAPVGLFGADYLQNYDVELDISGGKVNLFNQEHCPDRVVYWAPEFFKVPIYFPGNGTLHRIMVDVTVDGKPLRALIDTGAPANVMRLAVAQDRFDLSSDSSDMKQIGTTHGVEGRQLPVYEHRFQSFAFGGITLHNTPMNIVPINTAAHVEKLGSHIKVGSENEPDVYIGMSLLKQLRLYVSYSEKALYFTVAPPKQAAVQ